MLTVGSDPQLLINKISNSRHMLERMICHVFSQGRQGPPSTDKINSDGTIEGSRAYDFFFDIENGKEMRLRLWAPSNYVHVLIREEKRGPMHKIDADEWEHRCCHDSCWRDAVRDFIRDYDDQILRFGYDPYEVVVLSREEQNHMRKLRKEKERRMFRKEKTDGTE